MDKAKTIADLIEDRYGISSGAGSAMPAEGELASILSHRTHRRFTDQPVSNELLEVLLAAAFSAPAVQLSSAVITIAAALVLQRRLLELRVPTTGHLDEFGRNDS